MAGGAGMVLQGERIGHAGGWGVQAAALPAIPGYIACIMGVQYTIRSVPEPLDRAVRDRAGRGGKSINAVVVEALARGLDPPSAPAHHTDLDHLIGTWQEDPAFDRAVAEFERIDAGAWQ